MSYNVSVGDESFNYTYNLAGFFREFKVRPADWNEQRADHLAFTIGSALRDISGRTECSLKQYDPENGWGSWQLATEWLTKVMVACIENPGAEVVAS